MNHFTPDNLVERSLERAAELLALRMLSNGSNQEINDFAENIHKRLDLAIDRTLHRMEHEIRIREALKNPKIA